MPIQGSIRSPYGRTIRRKRRSSLSRVCIAIKFGLKNAPATFQRLVNNVLSNQIGRNLEAYIDDMIVKSKQVETHIDDLRETFSALRQHNMKLNQAGVTKGKFLGFLIDERGIEANPEKVQAVINMGSPTCVKEVKKLTGCLAALGRFLSRSGS